MNAAIVAFTAAIDKVRCTRGPKSYSRLAPMMN
jgi:hypothetical protein